MPYFLNSYRTTIMGLLPLIGYALKYAGFWPDTMPLPPIEQVWPFVLALFGLGLSAKDSNITGGNIEQ